MIVRTIVLVALLALVSAQQGHVNYVEDYDYQDSAPARRPPARPSHPQQAFAHRGAAGPTTQGPPRQTPVPILKQINKHNEDGSYTYGYEGADGSFKIETKYPTGDVKGKYGYVDDTGKLRVVEYGADKFGFQPTGEGITVPPPTLVDESINEELEQEDPLAFRSRPQARPAAPQQRPRRPPPPPPQPQYYEEPQQVYREPPQQAPRFRPEESYEIQTSFNHPRPEHRPRPVQGGAHSQGPVPARAVIPGAAPVQPHHQDHSAPRAGPARPRPPQPIPQARNFAPAPVQHAPVHHAPAPARPAPRPQASQGGILDQLARDYALPQGGGLALHDISFGYY